MCDRTRVLDRMKGTVTFVCVWGGGGLGVGGCVPIIITGDYKCKHIAT